MSDTRRDFYQLRYASTGKPIWMEDMGNCLQISGILLEGMGTHVLVLTPGANLPIAIESDPPLTVKPTLEEWCELLRISDDPKIYEQDATGTIKAIHRKSERSIGGAVQQQIWVRDGLQCMFCFRPMGKVQLTVDHFLPVELGGTSTDDNLISCCRQCNKLKGNRDPQEFCEAEGLDYKGRVLYLAGKAPKSFISDSR